MSVTTGHMRTSRNFGLTVHSCLLFEIPPVKIIQATYIQRETNHLLQDVDRTVIAANQQVV